MIERIIEYSVRNRALVLLVTAAMFAVGIWATYNIRLDAIPDLSDVQVIVVTEYAGQNPKVVDDQVTYPLSSAMLSVPGATVVRGFSMYELSFVYVLFEDDTDLYWARSRVLEYLSFAKNKLPSGVEPRLGPDATGVGWVYQYVLYPGFYCEQYPQGIFYHEATQTWYGSVADAPAGDRNELKLFRAFEDPGVCPVGGAELIRSTEDLASLRTLQDYYMRFPLIAVEGVSEVAPFGGFVKQYQVTIDPQKLQAYDVPLTDVITAIQRSNNEVGGSVLELSEHEYMVRSRGYLQGVEDIKRIPVKLGEKGTPVFLDALAEIQIGGESRRGIGELNGEGEAVGGVVISRFGANAYKVIEDTKTRIKDLEQGLPPGVMVKTTYDRSALIERSVDTLRTAVLEELLVTALICLLFLGHLRSAFVAVVVLPAGVLFSLVAMKLLEINANIMSLGGLALAVGVMVDSAIVMIENAHQRLSEVGSDVSGERRNQIILQAAKEVGPSLFFSLLVITVSFLPIFVLGEQSGRLFQPLAYTKTFAIFSGALLGITLVPVLMTFFIRGKLPDQDKNIVNVISIKLYEPAFHYVLKHPGRTLLVVCLIGLSTIYPIQKLGSEFMPPLDEGDLLYMPTTDPSISITKSKELLQQTDRLIKTFPEVVTVHGKIGRADTATDPAPLSMIETVVQLETDRSKWRMRRVARFYSFLPNWLTAPLRLIFPDQRTITLEELKFGWHEPDGTFHPGLQTALTIPGVANAWPYPIENRINMLTTGIKTPVGIKIVGPDLETLSSIAQKTALVMRTIPGTVSSYPEQTVGGYYLDIDIHRENAARYGLSTGEIQEVIQTAISGMNLTTTVEGIERYPLNLRYPRELRDSIPALLDVLVPTATGAHIPLGQLASIAINPGPSMIRSENAQHAAWIYVDISGRDLGGYITEAKKAVAEQVLLPPGYARVWSGRFEYLEKAYASLKIVVPLTVLLIIVLLYISNKSWFRVSVILLAVPFSLVGAFWFLYLLDYNMSLAVWVGIIALLGVDAETGQVMLLYLENSFDRFQADGRMRNRSDLREAIHDGAVKRIRPKTMTVATDMIGLLPLLWASGTGADMTRRLVAPLIGGITVSFLMELLVYPVIFYLAKARELQLTEEVSKSS